MIRALYALIVTCALTAGAASAPIEVWLTPARAEELKRVTVRPYVVAQERLNANTVVYHWTNGLHGVCTTQRVEQVLGKKSKSAWQDKLDAKDAEKKSILDDLEVIKAKPTKKAIEDLITKSKKGSAK